MVINLKSYLDGKRDYDKGYQIYKDIHNDMKNGETVYIDCIGTGGFGSSLLHGFLGESLREFGLEETRHLMKFKNIGIGKGDIEFIKEYAKTMMEIINKEKNMKNTESRFEPNERAILKRGNGDIEIECSVVGFDGDHFLYPQYIVKIEKVLKGTIDDIFTKWPYIEAFDDQLFKLENK